MKTKALVLFSGGLDSMLVVKLLQEQNIRVDGICFRSSFFEPHNALKSAETLGLHLDVVDIGQEILKLVKNPPSGYGKNLNPCLDCHALMIKKAGQFAKKEKYDMVATGEVLGQRPFSQRKEALDRVRKLSGVDVLRPLSAKMLNETRAESLGLVKRGKLLSIHGRGRDKQLELIRKYGVKKFPMPAGGCALTDPGFCERLGVLLDNWPKSSVNDTLLIKNGRIFWLTGKSGQKTMAIIGRNEKENEALKKLAQKGDFVLELKEMAGPTALIRNLRNKAKIPAEYSIEMPKDFKLSALKLTEEKNSHEILEAVAMLAGYYSRKAGGKRVGFDVSKIISKL
jgi:tRNA-uridine 2-sulfurtransferase